MNKKAKFSSISRTYSSISISCVFYRLDFPLNILFTMQNMKPTISSGRLVGREHFLFRDFRLGQGTQLIISLMVMQYIYRETLIQDINAKPYFGVVTLLNGVITILSNKFIILERQFHKDFMWGTVRYVKYGY